MLDAQIQAVLQPLLVAGLAARSVSAAVKQNNQPRQFVAPTTPTVFHTLGPRKKYGWPVAKDVFNETTGAFDTTTTQVVQTRFQIAGCVPNPSPAAPMALTSGDLASIASDILNHELSIAQFVAAGFNVFRVMENQAIPFQDSNDQTIWWASFDIIFTHKDVFTTSTGKITEFDSNVFRV
jgi:hypothetical protein